MKKIYTILFVILIMTIILPCESIMALGGELINNAKKEVFAIDEIFLSHDMVSVHYYGPDKNTKTNFLNIFWVDFERVPEGIADQRFLSVSTVTPEWAENYYRGKSELSPDNKEGIWHSYIYNNQNAETLEKNKSNVLYYVVQLKNGSLVRGKADYRDCARMEDFDYENSSCKLEKKCDQLYYWGYLAGYGRLGDDEQPIISCDIEKDADSDNDNVWVDDIIDNDDVDTDAETDGDCGDNKDNNGDVESNSSEHEANIDATDGRDSGDEFNNGKSNGLDRKEGFIDNTNTEKNEGGKQDIINYNWGTKENDSNQEAMDDFSNQIKTTENSKEMENIKIEVPNLGGESCEKNIYFPWWFLVLLAICDVILLWWWSPKREEQKNR